MNNIIIPSNNDMEETILHEAATKKLVMGLANFFQEPPMNLAFGKCMEMGWIRIFDVIMVLPNPMAPPGPQNQPMAARVFKITNTGDERLREIRRKKEIDARMKVKQ